MTVGQNSFVLNCPACGCVVELFLPKAGAELDRFSVHKGHIGAYTNRSEATMNAACGRCEGKLHVNVTFRSPSVEMDSVEFPAEEAPRLGTGPHTDSLFSRPVTINGTGRQSGANEGSWLDQSSYAWNQGSSGFRLCENCGRVHESSVWCSFGSRFIGD